MLRSFQGADCAVIAEYMSLPVPATTRAAEGRRVEFVLSVQVSEVASSVSTNQRRPTVKKMQEVTANRVIVGLDVDAAPE